MPRMLVEALHSAAVTLPPAIEVKATEACIVEGKVHKTVIMTIPESPQIPC